MSHRMFPKASLSSPLCLPRMINSPNKTRTRYITTSASNPRLTNVLITGGSRGIGLAIAHTFLKTESYKVTILGRDPSRLKTACQDLLQQNSLSYHDNIDAIEADITKSSIWTSKDISTLIHQNVDPFKDGIDVLINAAGVTHSSLLSAMSVSRVDKEIGEVERIMDTNLMGTIYACRGVSKIMIRNRRRNPSPVHSPCIINVSSLLGVLGGRGASVYAASKAGVLGEFIALPPSREDWRY
jgi:NAD(P)-dependent dehydrogenase (short-subunit alcohol dehydrogenase family)